MDINNTNTNPIQIVAFSTNDTYQTPNDFINIFLSFQKHKILKKSHHSISFNLTIPNVSYPVKIMVYTVSKFDRSYSGLCDVNCYMIFINIDESEANKKLDDIITYMQNNCDESKKIFIFAISNNQSNDNQTGLTKDDIVEKFQSIGKKIEIKVINNLEKTSDICDYFIKIFLYSHNHLRKKDHYNHDDEDCFKNKGQSGSCNII